MQGPSGGAYNYNPQQRNPPQSSTNVPHSQTQQGNSQMRPTQLLVPNQGTNAQAQAQMQSSGRPGNPLNNQQQVQMMNNNSNVNMNNRNIVPQHSQGTNNQQLNNGQQGNNGGNRTMTAPGTQHSNNGPFANGVHANLMRSGGSSTPSGGSPMLLSHNPGSIGNYANGNKPLNSSQSNSRPMNGVPQSQGQLIGNGNAGVRMQSQSHLNQSGNPNRTEIQPNYLLSMPQQQYNMQQHPHSQANNTGGLNSSNGPPGQLLPRHKYLTPSGGQSGSNPNGSGNMGNTQYLQGSNNPNSSQHMQYFNNPHGSGGNMNTSVISNSGANMNPNYMSMGLSPTYLGDQQGSSTNSNGGGNSGSNYSSRMSPTVGNLLSGNGTPNKQSHLLSSIPNMNSLQLPVNSQYSQGRNSGNGAPGGNFSSNTTGNSSTGSLSSLVPSPMHQGSHYTGDSGHGNYNQSQNMAYRSGNASSNSSLSSLNNNGNMLLPQFAQGSGNNAGPGSVAGGNSGPSDMYSMNQNGQYLQGGLSPAMESSNPNNSNIVPLIPPNSNMRGQIPSNTMSNANSNVNRAAPGNPMSREGNVNPGTMKGVPVNNTNGQQLQNNAGSKYGGNAGQGSQHSQSSAHPPSASVNTLHNADNSLGGDKTSIAVNKGGKKTAYVSSKQVKSGQIAGAEGKPSGATKSGKKDKKRSSAHDDDDDDDNGGSSGAPPAPSHKRKRVSTAESKELASMNADIGDGYLNPEDMIDSSMHFGKSYGWLGNTVSDENAAVNTPVATPDVVDLVSIQSDIAALEKRKEALGHKMAHVERKQYILGNATKSHALSFFPRAKCKWDFILEEAQWMAIDLFQERRWMMKNSQALVKCCSEAVCAEAMKRDVVEQLREKTVGTLNQKDKGSAFEVLSSSEMDYVGHSWNRFVVLLSTVRDVPAEAKGEILPVDTETTEMEVAEATVPSLDPAMEIPAVANTPLISKEPDQPVVRAVARRLSEMVSTLWKKSSLIQNRFDHIGANPSLRLLNAISLTHNNADKTPIPGGKAAGINGNARGAPRGGATSLNSMYDELVASYVSTTPAGHEVEVSPLRIDQQLNNLVTKFNAMCEKNPMKVLPKRETLHAGKGKQKQAKLLAKEDNRVSSAGILANCDTNIDNLFSCDMGAILVVKKAKNPVPMEEGSAIELGILPVIRKIDAFFSSAAGGNEVVMLYIPTARYLSWMFHLSMYVQASENTQLVMLSNTNCDVRKDPGSSAVSGVSVDDLRFLLGLDASKSDGKEVNSVVVVLLEELPDLVSFYNTPFSACASQDISSNVSAHCASVVDVYADHCQGIESTGDSLVTSLWEEFGEYAVKFDCLMSNVLKHSSKSDGAVDDASIKTRKIVLFASNENGMESLPLLKMSDKAANIMSLFCYILPSDVFRTGIYDNVVAAVNGSVPFRQAVDQLIAAEAAAGGVVLGVGGGRNAVSHTRGTKSGNAGMSAATLALSELFSSSWYLLNGHRQSYMPYCIGALRRCFHVLVDLEAVEEGSLADAVLKTLRSCFVVMDVASECGKNPIADRVVTIPMNAEQSSKYNDVLIPVLEKLLDGVGDGVHSAHTMNVMLQLRQLWFCSGVAPADELGCMRSRRGHQPDENLVACNFVYSQGKDDDINSPKLKYVVEYITDLGATSEIAKTVVLMVSSAAESATTSRYLSMHNIKHILACGPSSCSIFNCPRFLNSETNESEDQPKRAVEHLSCKNSACHKYHLDVASIYSNGRSVDDAILTSVDPRVVVAISHHATPSRVSIDCDTLMILSSESSDLVWGDLSKFAGINALNVIRVAMKDTVEEELLQSTASGGEKISKLVQRLREVVVKKSGDDMVVAANKREVSGDWNYAVAKSLQALLFPAAACSNLSTISLKLLDLVKSNMKYPRSLQSPWTGLLAGTTVETVPRPICRVSSVENLRNRLFLQSSTGHNVVYDGADELASSLYTHGVDENGMGSCGAATAPSDNGLSTTPSVYQNYSALPVSASSQAASGASIGATASHNISSQFKSLVQNCRVKGIAVDNYLYVSPLQSAGYDDTVAMSTGYAASSSVSKMNEQYTDLECEYYDRDGRTNVSCVRDAKATIAISSNKGRDKSKMSKSEVVGRLNLQNRINTMSSADVPRKSEAPQWNVHVKLQRLSVGSGSSGDEGSRRRLLGKLLIYVSMSVVICDPCRES